MIFQADPTPFTLPQNKVQEIRGMMDELLQYCRMHRIPMYCTFAVSNSEDETVYERATYSATGNGIRLKDDQIRKHMLVANGFEPYPKRDVLTVNIGEVLS